MNHQELRRPRIETHLITWSMKYPSFPVLGLTFNPNNATHKHGKHAIWTKYANMQLSTNMRQAYEHNVRRQPWIIMAKCNVNMRACEACKAKQVCNDILRVTSMRQHGKMGLHQHGQLSTRSKLVAIRWKWDTQNTCMRARKPRTEPKARMPLYQSMVRHGTWYANMQISALKHDAKQPRNMATWHPMHEMNPEMQN